MTTSDPAHVIDMDARFIPTPEEIRAACAEIQAGWSESERRTRGRGTAPREWPPGAGDHQSGIRSKG